MIPSALRHAGLALLFAIVISPASAVEPKLAEFSFAHDRIIGTSLDLKIVAPDEATALAAEEAILAEIERLRKIFSTYDSRSELCKLNAAPGAVSASSELIEVLKLYEAWHARTGGAFSGRVGLLVNAWRAAEKAGVRPDTGALETIVRELAEPGWSIDAKAGTVTKRPKANIDLNAIAKGYILEKSAAAARSKCPALKGLLINLGGDIHMWGTDATGSTTRSVGIQDPHNPADNAELLAAVRVERRAIATSGGYQRFYTIEGKKYSHILDPRTGEPTGHIAGATVIAAHNTTANALATTLCVLTPEEGLKLIAATAGAECIIVDQKGQQHCSPGFAELEFPLPKAVPIADKPAAAAWPDGKQVTVALELPSIADGKRYRRPYVAIWIEDKDGKAVRTLSVWGNSSRYLKDLNTWWKFAKDDATLVNTVTRATRSPGKYEVVWDGKDDAGKAVGQGTFTVKVEVHREHGKHLTQSGKIECGKDDAKATLDKNEETAATEIAYAPKKKK
jgi:thiamine biosynthesis lipoprotein